jgi:anthranilate phosphoribosyltransferase
MTPEGAGPGGSVAPAAPTWPSLLSALLAGRDLSTTDTAWAMAQVILGEATPVQVAGFVVGLRAKGEAPDEVTGLVRAMLDGAAARITLDGPAVDTCGTGGDRANTVNISTMSAMVVAGTGARVVKHGNRSASSACGSADLLEELGVVVDLEPAAAEECLRRIGVTFCFAPVFHRGLRHTAVPRRELGVPTIFNILGPLCNPAQPSAQAVGCADPRLAAVMAQVLADRGTSALVFRGDDGLDELTPTTTSQVWVVRDGDVRTETLAPEDVGLQRAAPDALRGGDRVHNAGVTRRFLAGESGPVRDAVLLNAAAALVALEPGSGSLAEGLAAALARAAESVDNGAATRALAGWVDTSQALRTA